MEKFVKVSVLSLIGLKYQSDKVSWRINYKNDAVFFLNWRQPLVIIKKMDSCVRKAENNRRLRRAG